MATKTVYIHRYIIPPCADFRKKYYFLMALLLLEYNTNGYYEDRLEIAGFNEKESTFLCETFSFFYQQDNTLMIDEFDTSLLEKMSLILSLEQQQLLVDHIILSSIDRSSKMETLLSNLKNNITKLGVSVPLQYFSELDFLNFLKEN